MNSIEVIEVVRNKARVDGESRSQAMERTFSAGKRCRRSIGWSSSTPATKMVQRTERMCIARVRPLIQAVTERRLV